MSAPSPRPPGPTDGTDGTDGTDDARRRWAVDRRAAARRHHPDVGGSTEALLQAYAEVDVRHGFVPGPDGGPGPAADVRTTPWWRRRLRAATRRVRRASRRRYIDIT